MAYETIREFTHSGGARLGVDRESGVIRGVKLLGLESQNGRTYPKETVARAVSLYEGAKVNVDHGADPKAPRSYSERIGVVRNVHLDQGADGLRGDFHANPNHQLFEQLAWDAENSPESVGFSHNILGKTSQKNGRVVVEEITRVQSVDLVADPATTRGLFEQVGNQESEEPMSQETLTMASLKADYPQLVEELRKEWVTEHANSEDQKAKDALIEEQAKELDTLKAEKAVAVKRENVAEAVKAAKLPEELTTDVFIEQLMTADEDMIEKLIEDRAALAKPAATPRSKEQKPEEGGGKKMDRKAFLEDLRGGHHGE